MATIGTDILSLLFAAQAMRPGEALVIQWVEPRATSIPHMRRYGSPTCARAALTRITDAGLPVIWDRGANLTAHVITPTQINHDLVVGRQCNYCVRTIGVDHPTE